MPQERQRHILEHLAQAGRVLAADVARRFGISEDTARREPAAVCLCRRVHGSALPLPAASGSFVRREGEQAVRKAALGRAGADLIARAMRPREVLLLDAGSTNLAVARALPPGLQITVVTNAPHVAAALAALGSRALRDLDAIHVDLAVSGACTLDAAAGLAAFDQEDAEFKRAAVRAGAMVATAATNEKLGTSAPFGVMPSSRLSHLVVEADAPSALVAAFQEIGVETHQALRT